MTDDLPTGPLPPLPPPQGAYDRVLRRAGARRRRRAVLSGALVLPVLAAALLAGVALDRTPERDALVAAPPSPSPRESAAPAPQEPSASASADAPSPTPESVPDASPQPLPLDPPPATPEREPLYQGRVVDAAGRPVAGAWVLAAVPDGLQGRQVGPDGRYLGQCGGPRELVAMWDLSLRTAMRQPRDMRNLAATWVNGGRTQAAGEPVPCGDPDRVVTTVLQEGGVVTGRIRHVDAEGREQEYADGADPGGGLYCRALGIATQPGQCANWDPVGGRYRFAGLPTGTYRLLGMHGGRDVQVAAGEVTELDWWECPRCAGRAPSAAPTPSPTP